MHSHKKILLFVKLMVWTTKVEDMRLTLPCGSKLKSLFLSLLCTALLVGRFLLCAEKATERGLLSLDVMKDKTGWAKMNQRSKAHCKTYLRRIAQKKMQFSIMSTNVEIIITKYSRKYGKFHGSSGPHLYTNFGTQNILVSGNVGHSKPMNIETHHVVQYYKH